MINYSIVQYFFSAIDFCMENFKAYEEYLLLTASHYGHNVYTSCSCVQLQILHLHALAFLFEPVTMSNLEMKCFLLNLISVLRTGTVLCMDESFRMVFGPFT